LIGLTDGRSNTTGYSYNTAGHLSQATYPGTDTVSYTSYADDGQVLQRVDGRSIVTNYVYADADGLLSAVQYPASTALNVGLSYDSYGRLSTMTDGTGSHGYSYDDRDELTSETTTYTGIAGKTVSYTFHPDGSRATMGTPAGTFSYYYDGAGRGTSVVNPFSETTAWTYLDNDWLKTQTLHNSVRSTYTYNALGLLLDLETRNGTGAMDPMLSAFNSMTYDGLGNRLSVTSTITGVANYSGLTSYTYNSKDELTQESSARTGGYTHNFTYDGAGNPTSFKGTSYTYNSNNQQSGSTHDGNGNPTTYQGVTCTFDPENRMTGVGTVLAATYRGDGLRAKKTTAGGSTYFLYDGELLLAEMNGSGTVTALNTWGSAGLASRNTSGGTVYYTWDHQGSLAQRLDGMVNVLTSHMFDAYGTGASTGATTDPYGYDGQWGYLRDGETGLHLLTHRYYDAGVGRFLTRDPTTYIGGVNLYGYCTNQPIDWQDYSGLAKGGKQSGKGNDDLYQIPAEELKRRYNQARGAQKAKINRILKERGIKHSGQSNHHKSGGNRFAAPECSKPIPWWRVVWNGAGRIVDGAGRALSAPFIIMISPPGWPYDKDGRPRPPA
jgi:RHS repeat-associated protein